MEIIKTKVLVHSLVEVNKANLEMIASMFGTVDNIHAENVPAILFHCDLNHIDPARFSGIDIISFTR